MKSLTGLLLLLLLSLSTAHAATPLPPAPPNGYCYDSAGDAGFIGVRPCPTTPPPPPPPAGTLLRANITYIAHGVPETAPNVDLTDWTPVWGRIDVTDGAHHALVPQPWYGANGSTPQFFLPNNQQICARFVVPTNTPMNPGINPTTHLPYTYGPLHKYIPSSYNTGAGYSIGISPTCGVIPPAPCGLVNVGAFDQGLTYRAGTGNNFTCGLAPGSTLFTTVKWTAGVPVEPNPGPHAICTRTGCKLALQHN